MGLFGRKKQQEELELPPPPPPVSEENAGNEMFSGSMEEGLPPLLQAEEPRYTPKYVESKIKAKLPYALNLEDLEKELPPVPPIEELGEEMPNLREMGKNEIQKLEFPEVEEEPGEEVAAGPIEELETDYEEEPKRRIVEGPIFVNIKSYKDVTDSINIIKSKIKESEDYVARLNEIKNMKEKYFEQLRIKLEDLQRKSLYIDKSLFEGVK